MNDLQTAVANGRGGVRVMVRAVITELAYMGLAEGRMPVYRDHFLRDHVLLIFVANVQPQFLQYGNARPSTTLVTGREIER